MRKKKVSVKPRPKAISHFDATPKQHLAQETAKLPALLQKLRQLVVELLLDMGHKDLQTLTKLATLHLWHFWTHKTQVQVSKNVLKSIVETVLDLSDPLCQQLSSLHSQAVGHLGRWSIDSGDTLLHVLQSRSMNAFACVCISD